MKTGKILLAVLLIAGVPAVGLAIAPAVHQEGVIISVRNVRSFVSIILSRRKMQSEVEVAPRYKLLRSKMCDWSGWVLPFRLI